jgi:hypothetical protein
VSEICGGNSGNDGDKGGGRKRRSDEEDRKPREADYYRKWRKVRLSDFQF